ncbi:hypothetical protein [Maridesulfovibrio bastinii]|uniref:hypothetical protein n=1 Tax=Maridesulfovibrio bastinii TaxID=47157 RepID=UPI0004095757|nr:hypothetical protein [Maridesulfovibrio bastinii]
MSKSWIRAKMPEFVRDMFRDFCQSTKILEEQFEVFDRERSVSFEVLNDLLGSQMTKGMLWRLKDTSHHLFRNDPNDPLVGRFLDWGIGYIFHEIFKLREDAYQNLNYAPLFSTLRERDRSLPEASIGEEFVQVVEQTEESMQREIDRVRFITARSRQLLPIYLKEHCDNELMGRLFFSQEELVRAVFRNEYDDLLKTIYGDHIEMMYILASRSLRKGGWVEEAVKASDLACKIDEKNAVVLQEKEIVDNWVKRFNV